jgi:hypothetical protein
LRITFDTSFFNNIQMTKKRLKATNDFSLSIGICERVAGITAAPFRPG